MLWLMDPSEQTPLSNPDPSETPAGDDPGDETSIAAGRDESYDNAMSLAIRDFVTRISSIQNTLPNLMHSLGRGGTEVHEP